MKSMIIKGLALSSLLTLSLVACSQETDQAAEDTSTAETTETTEESSDKPFEGTTLTAYVSYGQAENAFEKFTEETGIEVEFTPMSTGEVLSKLNAEDGEGTVDVWLGGGADAYIAAKDEGYLLQYESENAADIDEMFKDPDDYWTAVSFQAAGMMYNTEVLDELGVEAPETWEDLTDPAFQDEIIWANPAISGTAYSMLETMYQVWGEDQTFDYLTRLNENVSYYTDGGGEPSQKVASGEFAVGFVPITGEYYQMSEDYPVEIKIADDLLPWIPSPVAIFENTQNEEAAKVFVDYFTSKEGGDALQLAEERIMSRDDVDSLGKMPTVEKSAFEPVDMGEMAENRDYVLERFAEIAGSKAPVQE